MRWSVRSGNRGIVSAVQRGESTKLPASEQGVLLHLTDSHPTPRSAVHRSSRQTVRAVIVIGTLVIVFALDRMTASAPVQHLYYVPIIFGGLWFRRWGGVMAAAAAIVLYHLANPHLLTFRY